MVEQDASHASPDIFTHFHTGWNLTAETNASGGELASRD